MKRRLFSLLLTFTALAAVTPAGARTVTARIRYVSSEHFYLDVGAVQGLRTGMTAEVHRNGTTIGVLEVLHVADHSASCRLVGEATPPEVGDEVSITVAEDEAGGEEVPEAPLLVSRVRTLPASADDGKETPSRELKGSLGVTWDHTEGGGDDDFRTDYWSLPFRLEVKGLGRGWDLRTRGSLKRFERSGYSSSTPSGEWRNRIREVALVHDDPEADWNVSLGRVRSRATATAGPFDGFHAERRTGSGSYLGAFGGFAPEWGTLAFGTDDHVLGLTFRRRLRTESGRFLDFHLAGIGRYRSGEISREYLTWTASWRNGTRVSLMQAGEVDLNRGWRKDARGGSSLDLTSVSLTGRLQVSRLLAVDLGFDDRDLVRTWESRSLPDSLFEDSGRRGWRAGADLRFTGGVRLSASGSVRRDDRLDADVTSWNSRFFVPRLAGSDLALNAMVRGFDGPYLKGWAPQAGLSTRVGGSRVGLTGGGYFYQGVAGAGDRSNTWSEVRWSRDLSPAWSATAEYRKDWGDDIVGDRWWLEVRHRF
ncbi:MAG: hypothetical protein AB7V45_17615 [Candidatus Krumholzibacteriia bacterium]